MMDGITAKGKSNLHCWLEKIGLEWLENIIFNANWTRNNRTAEK